MAKRKQVARRDADVAVTDTNVSPTHLWTRSRTETIRGVAAALFAGTLVYATYYPSDSVAVERGDGLWLAALALVTSTILWAVSRVKNQGSGCRESVAIDSRVIAPVQTWRQSPGHQRLSIAIDALVIALAAWMMIAAFGISATGNLRQATNEAWLWVTAAAVVSASRRLFVDRQSKRAALVLLVGCAVGLSVHGMHQHFVSLPRTLAEYRQDPDAVLRMAGIDAPPGSSARMVFENRLLDGGPTSTFALANSLAGVLVLGYIVAGAGWLMCWRKLSKASFLIGLAIAGWIFAALFFTHSRSGLLAALAGVGVLSAIVLSNRKTSQDQSGSTRTRFRVLGVLAGVFVALVTAVMGLAVFGKQEWIAQAPSSLAFRFQYWRSTWRLVCDRPLFGAGPGNFQAVYPQYREASAAESIAEPHNFFFETLASGGFIAIVILLTLVAVIVRYGLIRSGDRCNASSDHAPRLDDSSRWWWLGGFAALTLIWLLGLATGQAPDWDAQIFAVPATIVVMTLAWRATSFAETDPSECDDRFNLIIVSAACGLMVHLIVSGGWTVPGVAIWLWMLVGMWVPIPQHELVVPNRRPMFTAIIVGLVLLASLRWISLGPVEETASLMRAATEARSERRSGYRQSDDRQLKRAIEYLDQANAADPWSPEASLWLADLFRWQVLLAPNDANLRSRWRIAVETSIRRSGGEPSLIRLVAAGPLHVYQRWGRPEDLQWAFDLYNLGCDRSPTDATFLAQRAEIAEKLGNASLARSDAERAMFLSELGENLERRLWLQPILVVEVLGEPAAFGPVLRTADKLLENQLDIRGVVRETN